MEPLTSGSQSGIEMQDSDWFDNMETENWECMFGGSDDEFFEY